jgi:hypothetical protein
MRSTPSRSPDTAQATQLWFSHQSLGAAELRKAWHTCCKAGLQPRRPLSDKGKPLARAGRKASGSGAIHPLTAGLSKRERAQFLDSRGVFRQRRPPIGPGRLAAPRCSPSPPPITARIASARLPACDASQLIQLHHPAIGTTSTPPAGGTNSPGQPKPTGL